MAILVTVAEETGRDSVLEVGQDLAASHGVTCHVLHVMSEERFSEHRERRSDFYRDDATKEAASIAQSAVDAVLEESDRVSAVGRVGDVTDQILAVADDVDASYIVVGSRKRTPVGKALLGSTTQSVILNADRPVVTVPASV